MTSPSKVIPAEAVEAAARAMYAQDGGVGEFRLWVYQDYAKSMLEAAAPHMLGPLLDDLRRERAKVELLLEGVEWT